MPRRPDANVKNDAIIDDEEERNREAGLLDDDALPEKETRAEKKRKALQLERLGELLVKLPAGKLARVPMPDDLAAAVVECRRILEKGARGGYRRQVQFIGKIMRFVDAQPIADALESMKQEDAPSAAAFRAAEVWRDRLMSEGDVALEALVKEKPAADRTLLRQLIRAKSGKVLFREIKALFDPPAPSTSADDE